MRQLLLHAASMSAYRQSAHADRRTASEAKMPSSLILVPALLAALSLTLALQSASEPTSQQSQRTEIAWSRLITVVTDPDLQAVVAFCVIGLLLALNFILRFPDFGALIEQYNQF
jgi:hypothetical protein